MSVPLFLCSLVKILIFCLKQNRERARLPPSSPILFNREYKMESNTRINNFTNSTLDIWNTSDPVSKLSSTENLSKDVSSTPEDNFEVESDLIFLPNTSIIYGALFAAVIVPAILGNVLVILSYIRYYHLRTSINTYIVNLAVCDLLLVTVECVPIIIQYLFPSRWSRHIVNNIFCTFSFLFNTFFGTAAIMTLLALSVERFCCVIHPVTTMAFATRTETRAKFILVLVWCVAILPHFGNCVLFNSVKTERHVSPDGNYIYDVTFCVSAKADDNLFYGSFYTATVFLLLYASTFITTLAIYLKIIRKLRKRNQGRFDTGTSDHGRRFLPGRNAHEKAYKQTIKLMAFSVVSYLFCYSFYFYANFYHIYFGLYKRQGFTVILLANWLGALNSCFNPITHALFVSRFRRALKSFLFCRTMRPERTGSGNGRGSSRIIEAAIAMENLNANGVNTPDTVSTNS